MHAINMPLSPFYLKSAAVDFNLIEFCFLDTAHSLFENCLCPVCLGLTCTIRMLSIIGLMLLVVLIRGVGQAHCRLLS